MLEGVTAEDTLVTPIPGPQTDFVLSEVRYPAFVGGVGSGKTIALMMKAMWDFSTYASQKPGMLAVFTVPTMFGADLFFMPKWSDLYRDFRGTLWEWHEKKACIRFPQWDGTMFIRSAGEPEPLRGGELARGYMDEAASLAVPDQEMTFRIGQGRIRQQGFGPNQISVATTPQQTRQWIIKRWLHGINPLTNRPHKHPYNYKLFLASTDENPHLDQDYKDDLAAEWGDSRWGRQERGGEFLSLEGLMYDHIKPEDAFIDPHPETVFNRTVYGIDFGVSSPTAIIEWKRDTSGRKWATDEFYKRNASEEDWVRWLSEKNATMVRCDPSASEQQIQYWRQRYALNIQRSRAKSFGDRVNLWKGLGQTVFITRKARNAWEEVQNLAQRQNKQGDWLNEWAPGCADHAWDGGAYGLSDFHTYAVPKIEFVRRAS